MSCLDSWVWVFFDTSLLIVPCEMYFAPLLPVFLSSLFALPPPSLLSLLIIQNFSVYQESSFLSSFLRSFHHFFFYSFSSSSSISWSSSLPYCCNHCGCSSPTSLMVQWSSRPVIWRSSLSAPFSLCPLLFEENVRSEERELLVFDSAGVANEQEGWGLLLLSLSSWQKWVAITL
jgi:hypothetical protein